MGCFDWITFRCPDCGSELDAQSKSGDCLLNSYDHKEVPVSVSLDANRHAPYRCECGSAWEFGNIPDEEVTVSLTLNKYKEPDDGTKEEGESQEEGN